MDKLWTEKQSEYINIVKNNPTKYNFQWGATGTGKTVSDIRYLIPHAITSKRDQSGLVIIGGVSEGTIKRNVLEPLREFWGEKYASAMVTANQTRLFGETVHILGAEKVNQVNKFQGATIKTIFCDEIAKWNEEVFHYLHTRLRAPNSQLFATFNPEYPEHFIHQFLESEMPMNVVHSTLYDNTFLTAQTIRDMEMAYQKGTVHHTRFILGLPARAEGLIYQQFADDPKPYTVSMDNMQEHLRDVMFGSIGIDFGGTRSLTTFVASAIHQNCSKVTVTRDHHIKGQKGDIDAERLCNEFVGFVQRHKTQYPRVYLKYVFADSEAQYLINSLRKAIRLNGLGMEISDSAKNKITDRIIAGNTLLNTGRMYLSEECELVAAGLRGATWSKDKPDTRLDNFSSDIDIIDGFEYSWEPFMRRLCPETMKGKRN